MHTVKLILSAAVLLACLASPASTFGDDIREVEQAAAQFYQSLNALFTGDVAPMEQVWSHEADVSYMGPAGGFEIGWEKVQANWDLQASKLLGGHVEPSEMTVTVGNDLAIVQCYERGNNVDPQGRPLPVDIRATNIFRKENGQWKMIGHHTDLLPYLQKQALTGAIE
jgi:ketosteroid isomerase-like protein